MSARRRVLTAVLSVSLIAVLPGAAAATDRGGDPASSDTTRDAREDPAPARPAEESVEPARERPEERPSDRPTKRPEDTLPQRPDKGPDDTASVRPAERVSDEPADRCERSHRDRRCVDEDQADQSLRRCLNAVEHERRCFQSSPPAPEVNVRSLIWRLINAQEWGMLLRLLIRLGLV